MVKSLKYQPKNKNENKSRRKSSRIKTGGASESQENSQDDSEDQYARFCIVNGLRYVPDLKDILDNIQNQSFQQINDSIVELFKKKLDFNLNQLCALLYVFMYKIYLYRKIFWSRYKFPRIKSHEFSQEEIKDVVFEINQSSDETLLDTLWKIIQKFNVNAASTEKNVEKSLESASVSKEGPEQSQEQSEDEPIDGNNTKLSTDENLESLINGSEASSDEANE